MTGMKDQYFGVEVEMTGITREQAAQALADYFGTIPQYKGGTEASVQSERHCMATNKQITGNIKWRWFRPN